MNEGRYDPEHKGDKLLEALNKKRLSLLEFQRGIAKWLLDPEVWNTFHPKKFPFKTDKLLEHEAMPHSTRKDLSKQYFDDNPEILHYYSRQQAILAQNEQRVKDLTELMESIMDSAEVYEKLKARRAEFQQEVARQGSELGFRKYTYPEAEKVIKEFEGEIS